MNLLLVIEIMATFSSLLFIILLIRENIICWPFGILGSLLSIYLFIDAKLYSESVLYTYYVAMGIYGWIRWQQRQNQDNNPIVKGSLTYHLATIAICCALAGTMGYGFDNYTDAERPYIDAFTTIFSFAATLMEVRKVLETWVYWLLINFVSIWLYQDRDLDIYAALTGVYTFLSVYGFIVWQKAYRQQSKTDADLIAT